MPLASHTAFAGFTILRRLGSGGMGEVYLAQHPRLPRQDALKVLRADISADPDFRERFKREADLAAKLWHPHIVGIHDRGEFDSRLWISMDYVDGTDAGRMLRHQYPSGMPLPTAIEIVRAVASALDYAHARGLLHRDVKPSNILVALPDSGERRILLSDFGVARDLAETGSLTVTNTTVGTLAYAAPEQLMGLPLDGRADQYALAATAYHLLNGAPLFPHSNPAVVISQHLNAQPPALGDRRPELAPLDAVLSKALSKDPDNRFRCCVDFGRALEESSLRQTAYDWSAASTKLRFTPPTAEGASTHPARFRIALAAAAVVVVLCVVGAFLAVNASNTPTPPTPFSLTGAVHLYSNSITTTGLPSGFKCAGAQGYADIGPGAPITVGDEAGKLLAKGAFHSSYRQEGSCVLLFRIGDVPAGAKFYRVQVAQQNETSYTEAEAKAGIDISFGSSEPTATTTPPTTTTARPTTSVRTTTPVSVDPEVAALNQLGATADADKPYVARLLADHWVPQLSSKQPGIVADGVMWNYVKILQEHLWLRQQYPGVRLLWSSDWSTFKPGYWVTVAGDTFPDPDSALAWCTTQRRDRDHCFAKLISTTHGVEGATKYNK